MAERRSNLVFLEDTKFIYRTNFAGLPDEKYGSTTRYGNILIPDHELAEELMEEGYPVKMTKPKEGEEEGFEPRYYVKAILNYDSEVAQQRPPKIYLVEGDKDPELLGPDNVGLIDQIYVMNVKATLEKSYSKRYDKYLFYVKVMYVEHDAEDDPWGDTYRSDGQPEEDD
jgi:hypothetical protein